MKMGIMREQPKEGVKDSWKCPACRNINFKQRRACHRCNEPKPPPEVLEARKEQEEKREKATERRRQEQIENEKALLEEQAAIRTMAVRTVAVRTMAVRTMATLTMTILTYRLTSRRGAMATCMTNLSERRPPRRLPTEPTAPLPVAARGRRGVGALRLETGWSREVRAISCGEIRASSSSPQTTSTCWCCSSKRPSGRRRTTARKGQRGQRGASRP